MLFGSCPYCGIYTDHASQNQFLSVFSMSMCMEIGTEHGFCAGECVSGFSVMMNESTLICMLASYKLYSYSPPF